MRRETDPASSAPGPYPDGARARTRWIESLRPARVATATVDSWRPQGFFIERERTEQGAVEEIATVLLTNRECPWRCVMCDLWRHTLETPVPAGAILAQLEFALAQLPPTRRIKLYNSGSFFDPRAVPRQDWPEIAARLRGFERVVVECHPALINEQVLRFRDLLNGSLEVAMGLETACPEALERLNKRLTPERFRTAATFLRRAGIAVRAFVLVHPPFIPPEAAEAWEARSVQFALECGAGVVVLIPSRVGNGAMEALERSGDFVPPDLEALETVLDRGLMLAAGFRGITGSFSNCTRPANPGAPASLPARESHPGEHLPAGMPALPAGERSWEAPSSFQNHLMPLNLLPGPSPALSDTLSHRMGEGRGEGFVTGLWEASTVFRPWIVPMSHMFCAADGTSAVRGGAWEARVFADLWDLERLSRCAGCFGARHARLLTANETQQVRPRTLCSQCPRSPC